MSETKTENYDQKSFLQFMEHPRALVKLACLTQSLCIDGLKSDEERDEELNYVVDQTIDMVNRINLNTENIAKVNSEISEYMNEDGLLASNANYVMANLENLDIIPLHEMSTQFQDMVMQLQALTEKGQGEIAKEIMFLGLGIAKVEWTDRKKRPGIPYDPEEHGDISFSTSKTKGEV